jgi:uncharacterized protein YndB with AHSA1/START domain
MATSTTCLELSTESWKVDLETVRAIGSKGLSKRSGPSPFTKRANQIVPVDDRLLEFGTSDSSLLWIGVCAVTKLPLIFTYYIAAPIEGVWNGFVSKEANQKIFMGAEFEVDLKPGGSMTWSGPGADGKPTRYVTGRVLEADAPRVLEYEFGVGMGEQMSHVKIELTQESEAIKVVVTNDGWADNDPFYEQNADGWPRILSRLKTLLETGKTFRPH